MATGGATESRKQFHLPVSNITLTVTQSNIIETSAEAVATGEDTSLEGHGGVSQLLLKTCPRTYKSARQQLKNHTKKFEFGKVYPCTFPNPGKHPVSFSVVLHGIVPSARGVKSLKDWMDQMKVLYYSLFKAADSHGKSSLAIPLLGSGGAGATIDVAIDVIIHTLTTFRMKPDHKPSSQHLKSIILYVRKDAFGKILSKIEGKLKPLPQPNGIVPPASVRPGSGVGKTRPTSSKSRSSGSAKGSGRGSQDRVSSTWSGSRGAASAAAGGAQRREGEMSNLQLILADLTLETCGDNFPEEQAEEEMECDQSSDSEDEGNEDCGTKDDKEEEEDKCAICLDVMDNPKKLHKCGHKFCADCIEDSFKHHKPVCPSCNTVYGIIRGNQPKGTMTMNRTSHSLPGYNNCGQIIIDYEFPSGIQGPEHPNPGQPYQGTARRAFLPDSAEGKKVYRLLRVAFENRLTFTVGRSVTTGADNVVTWNDIHHKTRPFGGATGFGYPDPHYLSRVQEELAAKGLTEECLQGRTFDL